MKSDINKPAGNYKQILKPRKIMLIIPFGILSGIILGIELVALSVPIIGFINKRELVLRSLQTLPMVWGKVVSVCVLFIGAQILLRMKLAKRRIYITDDEIIEHNMFSKRTTSLKNIAKVEYETNIMAMQTDVWIYYKQGKRKVVSGFLMLYGLKIYFDQNIPQKYASLEVEI